MCFPIHKGYYGKPTHHKGASYPVSYTHLDVYKRQVKIELASAIIVTGIRIIHILLQLRVHIDVYKRQE